MPFESPLTTANTQHLKRKCLGVFQAPGALTYANGSSSFLLGVDRVSDLTLQSRRQSDPGTPLEVPVPDTSLITLLETSARLYPERIAVDYFGATLTYAQLYAQVLRAAQVLIETGLRRGDVCAICLPNCPQALVAFYACVRVGVVAAEHNPLATRSPPRKSRNRLGKIGWRVYSRG